MTAAAATSAARTAITTVRARTRTKGRPPPRARSDVRDVATVDS